MQITKNSIPSTAGPSEWFTGTVYIDTVTAPSAGSRLQASSVHFTPGARTAWHTHPNGQTIYVTEGIGLASVAAARSRSSVPVTAYFSSPVRSTGTAPLRTAS